jgi:hypothetical protein
LGFRVWGLRFEIWGLASRVWGFAFGFLDSFMILEFRIAQVTCCRLYVAGYMLQVTCFRLHVAGYMLQVMGL